MKINKGFNIIKILKEKNMNFSNKLIYEMDENFNNHLLEFGFYEMSDYNKKIYYDLKTYTNIGRYNYVKIEYDEIQGNIVKATTKIKKILVGDVLFLKDAIKKDIKMTRLWT